MLTHRRQLVWMTTIVSASNCCRMRALAQLGACSAASLPAARKMICACSSCPKPDVFCFICGGHLSGLPGTPGRPDGGCVSVRRNSTGFGALSSINIALTFGCFNNTFEAGSFPVAHWLVLALLMRASVLPYRASVLVNNCVVPQPLGF